MWFHSEYTQQTIPTPHSRVIYSYQPNDSEVIMKSNNHKIWDNCKNTPAYIAALSYLDQLKSFARSNNMDAKSIHILDKRMLTQNNKSYIDCEIQWHNGPENWAFELPLKKDSIMSDAVYVEAHEGSSLAFYTI